ncbi:unnamed protein product [Blumeria hordei]|uniref:EKC/KEOPS complex subunit BUD32 n=1 Tax=Blumeria hordei TaxID=2867405 RepID=A0A383ULE8_BLUHO|nr:unnamed protein product [Blumeria hordei]
MDVPAELLAYINHNPLDTILNRFRSTIDTSNNPVKVIIILITELTTFTLDVDLNQDIVALRATLYALIAKLSSNQISVSEFRVLVVLIKSHASDHEIWSTFIGIANRIDKDNKPTNTVPPTPVAMKEYSMVTKYKSASELVGYYATAERLTMALKCELEGKIYRNIDRFWEVNFEKKPWYKIPTDIWNSYSEDCKRRIGNVFSDNMDEKAVRRWMYDFRDRYLIQLMRSSSNSGNNSQVGQRETRIPYVRGKFCYLKKASEIKGGLNDCQLDFFMRRSDIGDNVKHDWRDVRVVGEVTSSNKLVADKIRQISRYMREIFYSQPLRRFAHGFCLHKNHIELWIVDRAGAYSSGEIDLSESHEMLVRVLSSYMLMSDEDLGLDPITSYDSDGRCFVTVPNGKESVEKIEVHPTPVTRPETIATRGNMCLETKDSMYMLKFSWGTESVESETKIFRKVKDVTGVITLNYSSDRYDIDEHRKGLKFSEVKKWYSNVGGSALSHGVTTRSRAKKFCISRQLTLAIFSSSCRPLKTSLTVREFVRGIRDAIIGHRNLHDKGVIHSDISAGNIILMKKDKTGESQGLLIDLDMASFRQDKKGKKRRERITGTIKYMALELLEAIDNGENTLKQTYRHDLESFFYVLIVGCMSYGHKEAPHHLDVWSSAQKRISCNAKATAIGLYFGEYIIDKFATVFKGVEELAWSFRKILFKDELRLTTPEDPNVLYDPIIRAFDDTIKKLEADVRERDIDDSIRKEA